MIRMRIHLKKKIKHKKKYAPKEKKLDKKRYIAKVNELQKDYTHKETATGIYEDPPTYWKCKKRCNYIQTYLGLAVWYNEETYERKKGKIRPYGFYIEKNAEKLEKTWL